MSTMNKDLGTATYPKIQMKSLPSSFPTFMQKIHSSSPHTNPTYVFRTPCKKNSSTLSFAVLHSTPLRFTVQKEIWWQLLNFARKAPDHALSWADPHHHPKRSAGLQFLWDVLRAKPAIVPAGNRVPGGSAPFSRRSTVVLQATLRKSAGNKGKEQ